MKSHYYDIVRQEDDNSAIWLEAVRDLNAAESRIQEFVSFWPGELQVMDQQNHQIVASVHGRLHRRTPVIEPQRYDNVRKSHIARISHTDPASDQAWLDLDRVASVEVTSEQPGYPIESALMGDSRGWRAADPGTQIV
jgi:hypothetical protein